VSVAKQCNWVLEINVCGVVFCMKVERNCTIRIVRCNLRRSLYYIRSFHK
jgi:hypothetical protein